MQSCRGRTMCALTRFSTLWWRLTQRATAGLVRLWYRLRLYWYDYTLAVLHQQRDRVNDGLAEFYLRRSEHLKAGIERGGSSACPGFPLRGGGKS